MIAMQYKIILPSDYPMESIENRIRDKGHLLDGYPGLLFKAFLFSVKEDADYPSAINSYAPFYVWRDTQAMQGFLRSEGFAALCEQFGRPEVKTWLLDKAPILPDDSRKLALFDTVTDTEGDVCGFDCRDWTSLRVHWLEKQLETAVSGQYYRIGYVAHG
ncbi:DUF4865 family protein [Vibrio mangrovi]|uniref:DUF4865 family protein n=1 Tax=Vibrio mangrovi TaxID=474394 RepID=A0A1Y6IYW0_9VIBR|nr:DUF4865 family protein [Vibrio mangrovi]MDW6002659.1 DUF4865 family protein [Vibrio mangrovi]SMS02818.1 hypothetical protein VIM7927_04160 [Vibrio mangrovi]